MKDLLQNTSSWNIRTPKETLEISRKENTLYIIEQGSEWHQISQKQYWKLEDNGAMPSQFWRRMVFQLRILYLTNHESNMRREGKRINFLTCKALKIFYLQCCFSSESYHKITLRKHRKIHDPGNRNLT